MCRYHSGLNRNRGLTAVELLFTVAIAGIVLALAVPSFRSFVQNNQAAEEANALVGSLALARSEAVSRGIPVSVCSSSDNETCAGSLDWKTGWIVFTDPDVDGNVDEGDIVLRAETGLRSGSELDAASDFIAYGANGFLRTAAGDFELAVEDCTGNSQRRITVNLQGRPSVEHLACD